MIIFTEEDFVNRYGFTLDSKMKVEAVQEFITHVAEAIYDEIQRFNNGRFIAGSETEFQATAIKNAQLIQAKYYIDNGGDLANMSGYDVYTNTQTPMVELERRYIAPLAKRKLINAGLLYRGV